MRVKVGGHGQGSLLKTDASENWFACFYVPGPKGKRVERRVTTGTPDEKRARAFLKARIDEVGAARRGLIALTPAAAQRVTVNELLDAWEADVKLRALKSAQSAIYHSRAGRVKFGSWRAMELTAENIDAWITEQRAARLAKATCNRRTQMLASAFKLGVERKKIPSAPTFRKLSEKGNQRTGFFETSELERLIPVLPEYLQDLTRFAFLSAWRKAECLSLTWDMVDLTAATMTLPTTKNGEPRTLHLGGEILAIIRRREAARLTERNGEPVVASHVFHHNGQPIKNFKRAWKSALVEAGLPHRLFHDLRRTGVRNLIRRGVSETVAMSISGHRTRSVFSRYDITSPDDQRKAMEAVSA